MKTITKILTEIVSDAFEKCGYDRALGLVTVSDRMDLCQFQCNGAFQGAKLYKKAPFMIAEDVASKLSDEKIFSKAEVVKPGFLNLSITDEYLLKLVREIAKDENLGFPQAEKETTVVIDYGGPNVAKALHIGHLRSANIGEALKRLARATGRKVYGDVHFGDWGTPIGLIITELHDRHPDWRCFAEDFNPDTETAPSLDVATLNEVYPLASKRSKEDEGFSKRAHEAVFELQNRRPGYIALWKQIMKASTDDIKGIYDRLNVSFDYWYGESDADKYIPELLDILNEKGLTYESDGALVCDVSEESDKMTVPPVIIKKSDGSSNYATTDLATILQREKDFKSDAICYVVDKRQSMHFMHVFRTAKKAGLVPETTELEHFGYGTMNGSDGKPYKTREGGVMKLTDLLDSITDAAYEKLNSSSFVSDEDRREIAQKVAIAAVKFGDLINHCSKDYIFDMDKFLSFEGKTGTYLLYTVTRINSIISKVGADDSRKIAFNGVYTDIERELLLNILLTGEVIGRAINEKAPNYVCENAYQLASIFSSFYHDNHIMNEEDALKKETWISLSLLTRKLILKHLDILAIEPVAHM